jgi:hypothetical protein
MFQTRALTCFPFLLLVYRKTYKPKASAKANGKANGKTNGNVSAAKKQ